MIIGTATIKLQASWVHSLKEKRMVLKSLIAKLKNKFNISVAEVEEMDVHQTIVIGICCVSCSNAHANSVINTVINFIENNTEAVVESVFMEII